MQGDDEWTGTLTDLDPTLAGADTLATFNPYSEGGRPGMRKAELPFMKDWQDRQATARSHYSTGSSLSLASHVIPEAFRKLDMTKLTVLPSLAEHHILDAPTSPPSVASPQDGPRLCRSSKAESCAMCRICQQGQPVVDTGRSTHR